VPRDYLDRQLLQGQAPGSETDSQKELTRKLFWAITSTIPLLREQRQTTFSWACELADKLLARAAAAPPPASRFQGLTGKRLAMERKKFYAAQAGGGAAGSSDAALHTSAPSGTAPSRRLHPSPQPSAGYAAFLAQDAAQRDRAVAYMVKENIWMGIRTEED